MFSPLLWLTQFIFILCLLHLLIVNNIKLKFFSNCCCSCFCLYTRCDSIFHAGAHSSSLIEAKTHQPDLHWCSSVFISAGFMMASFLPTHKIYSSLGRRKTAQAGLIITAYCVLIKSLCFFIPDDDTTAFLTASILFWLIEGTITGISLTALLSLLVLWHPNKTGTVISAISYGAYMA